MAAPAWHRISRVVPIAIRSFIGGGLPRAQRAVTEHGVRRATRVQIVFGEPRVRDRPVSGLAPAIGAHNEHTNSWLALDAVVLALQPVIEPGNLQALDRVRGLRPEIQLAYFLLPRQMD